MFGETAAVYAFLRVSRALAALSNKLLMLTLVNYFDDFTQIEPEMTCESAQDSIESLFSLLGWEIALEDRKRKPFNEVFVSLGALLNFSRSQSGEFVIGNKPGR
eukprot:8146954-Karenia_brevis.AAC.1